MQKFWLMKAEPDSRIIKGKDVKFSVDDFEACRTTAWEGVRNHEAKNIMKNEMKVGNKVFFYHSNCKNPGIAAIAEVSKEAYPDYTANDPTHPYYNPKSSTRVSNPEPTWWMVELTFGARLKNFVPLSVLRQITACSNIEQVAQLGIGSEDDEQPGLTYLSAGDLLALKAMPLLNRGRLSVQPVNAEAWSAIVKLGDRGGWGTVSGSKRLSKTAGAEKANQKANPTKNIRKRKAPDDFDVQTGMRAPKGDSNKPGRSDGPRRSKRLLI